MSGKVTASVINSTITDNNLPKAFKIQIGGVDALLIDETGLVSINKDILQTENSNVLASTKWVKSYLQTGLVFNNVSLLGISQSATAPQDTSSNQIASTEFVIKQASDVNPLMDGIASAGTSKRFARADHVHPTDTSRAPLISPSFTGTPTTPTPPLNDVSNRIANTNFVENYTQNIVSQIPNPQLLGTSIVKPIFYNSQTVSENIEIQSGMNAMSAGPITISDSFSVTVDNEAIWVIV